MKLSCILDTCPVNNESVDMRRCCGSGSRYSDKTVKALSSKAVTSPPCHFYGAEPWSEWGHVTCIHVNAKTADEETRKARRACFRATAGVAHLTMAGNLRQH